MKIILKNILTNEGSYVKLTNELVDTNSFVWDFWLVKVTRKSLEKNNSKNKWVMLKWN